MRKTIDGYLTEGDDSSWIHQDGDDGISGDGGSAGATSTCNV